MNFNLRRRALFTITILFLAANCQAQTLDPQLIEDRKLLAAANLPTEGPGLLQVIRKYIPTQEDQQRLASWADQLGSDSYRERERATASLIAAGPMAFPVLAESQRSNNLERARRAERISREIEATSWLAVSTAATRLVHEQRTRGASEALLAFLPLAADATLTEEIYSALDHLGVPDEAHGVMYIQALGSAFPAQRAAAALVLGHHGSTEQRSLVRQMASDPSSQVRLRVAQGLLMSGEKAAVDLLLELLLVDPATARQAEDCLAQIADGKAPDTLLSEGKEAQQRAHTAWREWWRLHRDAVDIARAVENINASPIGRARNLARRMLLALVAGDLSDLRQVVDVPFAVSDISLQKWSDVEEFFGQSLDDFRRGGKITFRVTGVVSIDEYLKTTREGSRFFTTLPKQGVRVVYVRGQFGNPREETGAVLVRVTGPARVIGIGPAENSTENASR